MRRSLLLSALFVAATLLACDEDPIAPPTTGSISLRVILGTDGQQQAPSLHTTAASEGANATPIRTATRAELKVKRSELVSESARVVARIEQATQDQTLTTTAPSTQPAAAPSTASAIDAATIYIIGPTNRTVTGQPGDRIVVEDLAPGSYRVVMLGWVGGSTGELDHYGETSVSVVAGENATATLSFTSFRPVVNDFATASTNVSFEVTFPEVPGADSYIVEFDTNTTFATSLSGSVSTAWALAVYFDQIHSR